MSAAPQTSPPLEIAQRLAVEFDSRAEEADRLGRLPPEDISALHSSGFAAFSVPKAYGGSELPLADCVAAQLELAKGSGSTALIAAMTLHAIGHEREQRSWPEALFDRLCSDVAGGALLNFAASEPKLGSPARGGLPLTEAVPSEDGTLLINGHKTWITGGDALDHLLVRLRFEAHAAIAWIPSTTEGIRWERTWGDGLSLRASNSNDLFLEQVTVPRSHLMEDKPGKAVPNVWFPLLIAATYLGIALAARDAVIRYALERTPTALGKPIATLPKIQREIGGIDIALKAAKQVLLATAGDWSGDPADARAYLPQTTAAKHLTDVTVRNVTDTALQLAGAAALERGLPLERYFRDVRAAPMHPPSGDAALEFVGRNALGV